MQTITKATLPEMKITLPGPKAKEILNRDAKYISPSYTRSYPLVVQRGYGAILEDVDGNTFLDFNAGVAVAALGHAHPEIVEVIARQARDFVHISGTDYYYPHQTALAEKLVQVTPGSFAKKVHYCNSGAEAMEAALKTAIYSTGRDKFIAFRGAFHGRTFGTLSLTASRAAQRRGFGPQTLDVTHVPFANPIRFPLERRSGESVGRRVARYIEQTIFKTTVAPEDCAAIVVEPVQGEGGYVVPSPDFLPELRRICDEHAIVLIVDEVQWYRAHRRRSAIGDGPHRKALGDRTLRRRARHHVHGEGDRRRVAAGRDACERGLDAMARRRARLDVRRQSGRDRSRVEDL